MVFREKRHSNKWLDAIWNETILYTCLKQQTNKTKVATSIWKEYGSWEEEGV
jgi:hypothetical protein